MPAAFHDIDPDQRRALTRRRSASIILTIAIELLLFLAILQLGRAPKTPQPTIETKVFRVSEVGKKRTPEKRAARAAPASAVAKPVVRPPIVVKKPPVPVFVPMSSEEFAATDISKLGKAKRGDAAGAGDEAIADGTGAGPGGATLYRAKWRREPSDQELAPYMPQRLRSGSALIICQTIANYHVENCRSLGETPPGSGLGQALRRASWQFLIVPPRIDGRALIGAWVSIRFDRVIRTDDAPASDNSAPSDAQ